MKVVFLCTVSFLAWVHFEATKGIKFNSSFRGIRQYQSHKTLPLILVFRLKIVQILVFGKLCGCCRIPLTTATKKNCVSGCIIDKL